MVTKNCIQQLPDLLWKQNCDVTELHQTKKKVKRQTERLTLKLKNTARTNIFNVVIFKLNIITNGGSKAVKKRHDKNYQNLEKN